MLRVNYWKEQTGPKSVDRKETRENLLLGVKRCWRVILLSWIRNPQGVDLKVSERKIDMVENSVLERIKEATWVRKNNKSSLTGKMAGTKWNHGYERQE